MVAWLISTRSIENDPARIIHDRPQPALIKRGRHVGRRPALALPEDVRAKLGEIIGAF